MYGAHKNTVCLTYHIHVPSTYCIHSGYKSTGHILLPPAFTCLFFNLELSLFHVFCCCCLKKQQQNTLKWQFKIVKQSTWRRRVTYLVHVWIRNYNGIQRHLYVQCKNTERIIFAIFLFSNQIAPIKNRSDSRFMKKETDFEQIVNKLFNQNLSKKFCQLILKFSYKLYQKYIFYYF
jgi:hypothetical protein